MKKLVFTSIFTIILSMVVFSQKFIDVVYLKNGSVIKGTVIEQVPNKQIKIQTKDGNIFVFEYDEIEKFKKEVEQPDLNEYGGKYSFGIALAGGGIFGFPARVYLNQMTALELGAYYRPTIVLNTDETYHGIMLAGGSNLYLKKHYKSKKEKVKLNGMSFKAGYSISKFTETFLSIGWAHESFKVTNKTHSFPRSRNQMLLKSRFDFQKCQHRNQTAHHRQHQLQIHYVLVQLETHEHRS